MASARPVPVAPRVLIAGGGIAALEAALALRATATRPWLEITILAPGRSVRYPPLAVMEPFVPVPPPELLASFARDVEADVVTGSLARVDVDARTAWTDDGIPIEYDALLVAIGARPAESVRGAIPFRGSADAPAVGRAIEDLRGGGALALVVPPSVSWSLPAYELALLAAARLTGTDGTVRVVTAEPAPLVAFGAAGGAVVGRRLAARGVRLHTDAAVDLITPGWLRLEDGRRLTAERVIALPVLVGRPVAGLADGGDGFLRTDDEGRVDGCPRVYAAGDVTAGHFKQGGLACQQADAAAGTIAEDLGVPGRTAAYRPVLRGLLVTGDAPEPLRRVLDERIDAAGELLMRPGGEHRPGAWLGGKVVGRHLAPYLAAREGPGSPEAPLRLPPEPVTTGV
ncbi:FAD-dependent oxidoreductase [Patulibacter sp. NPDC049589]|uniref:FAD-dependent oxidoreductase n=1 Tax=Patulibacter sp. NPDC049589 TaxID=3154731 RepID=UPI00341FC6C0